jgi:diadenosine tetraphosphatase ApaH/serine/threonine PP2A family protein phosphatase
MIAIISDVHGNLEALQAVLADAAAHQAEAVYCLGDLVGYGPDPMACLELAMTWPVVVQGQFDLAVIRMDGLDGWSAIAARNSVLRCRAQLRSYPRGADLYEFLSQRPDRFQQEGALFVHGTARAPVYEFMYPEDIYNSRKMNVVAQHFDELCFCGHTHIPGIFARRGQALDCEWNYLGPDECNDEYVVDSDKVICNVGSVGQPQDGDPRASYVLYSPEAIQFRRVDYDMETTIRKLRDEDDGDFFAARLSQGR